MNLNNEIGLKKNKVAIIGAGFSGLSLARYLVQSGIECEIFEASNRCGGLIKTDIRNGFLIESAANAILASAEVEKLFDELQIPYERAGYKAKARYIFRDKPRQIPLKLSEIILTLFNLLKSKFTAQIIPQAEEDLTQWSRRVAGEAFRNYLLEPALGGVYAAGTGMLSARLILAAFFNPLLKSKKGVHRGSLSPVSGMQAIIDALVDFLKSKNVVIHLNQEVSLEDLQNDFNFIVCAGSLKSLSSLFHGNTEFLGEPYKHVKMLDISTAVITPYKEKNIKGFGCLFPRSENFKSLGVLFNTDIFSNRGEKGSETWILPFVSEDQNVIKHVVAHDRLRLHREESDFEILKFNSYPQGLPHYDNNLLKFLESDVFLTQNTNEDDFLKSFAEGARLKFSNRFIYLTGNYLGGLGLSKILDYNLRLSRRIKKEIYEITHS